MNNFPTFIRLIIIMMLVSFLAIGMTTFFLYKDEINKQGARLDETARRLKRTAMSMVDYHIRCVKEGHHTGASPDHVKEESITQLKGAVSSEPLSDFIEVTIGYLRNNQIWWITQSFQDERLYVPIDMGHTWAKPMQLALQNKEGIIQAKDYRGKDVIAAYTYVDSIDVGIVVKTYIKSIRDRYVRGALLSSIPATGLIFLGVIAFIYVSKPLIKRLEDDNKNLRMIREQKEETETQLLEIEDRLRCFYDAAFEGISISKDGIFLDCNRQLADIIGNTRNDLIGKEIVSILPEEDREWALNKILSGYDRPYEARLMHKDGSLRCVQVHGQSTQYQGQKVRITVVRDLTSQKRIEAQVEQLHRHQQRTSKMEALGNFASGIAHDFNNTLQPIIGYCDVLLHEMKPDDEKRTHVLKIIASAETATLLVHRIQSFSRKRGKEAARLLKLPNCLRETFEFLRSMIPTSINMEINIEEDLGLVSATDITIRQVLMNICKNSAQAMGNDRGNIFIFATNDFIHVKRYGLKKGQYVKLEIEDDGCGMNRDVIDRALDPYFTTKRSEGGTGIGLAVVNGIVAKWGGYLRLYSEKGHGTRVVIYIPAVKENGQPVMECKLEKPVILGNQEHILLVDDEPAITEAIEKILMSLNYRVTSFNSSKRAFKQFALNPTDYDVLVTDLTMPEMSGIDLISNIRRIKSNIKVILCSGLSSNGKYRTRIYEDAIEEYLTKPVTRRGYSEALARVLGKTVEES